MALANHTRPFNIHVCTDAIQILCAQNRIREFQQNVPQTKSKHIEHSLLTQLPSFGRVHRKNETDQINAISET